ncbi:BMP family protein [Microtetraspora fusca]|uniref:BMP family protein n=1 Tax=Microtetraspora fusca TaxID=1997 RepID=A0ABW6VAR7_MICFU
MHNKRLLRVAAAGVGLTLALATAACGSEGTPAASGGKPAAKNMVAPLSGQLGDKSFMDSANRGFKRAETDLGVTVKVIEASTNDAPAWERNLREAAKRDDVGLVLTGGTVVASTLKKVSPAFPNQKFLIFDAPSQGPNSTGITYAQNEGAFLAGALAAYITKSPDKFPKAKGSMKVGLCAGMDIPVIRDFIVGFQQGVKTVDPNVTVDVRFTGDFVSPQKGFDTASAMFKDGADVVYQVAGPTGIGILKAAKEAGRYGIGTDSNQNDLHPGFIAASVIKSVDNTVYQAIKDFTDGKLTMGETRVGDLSNDGVSIEFDDAIVPADVQKQIGDLKQQVTDGKITVDTALK